MALVLAIGIVVDDAIVMLENIVRRIELGTVSLVAVLSQRRKTSIFCYCSNNRSFSCCFYTSDIY